MLTSATDNRIDAIEVTAASSKVRERVAVDASCELTPVKNFLEGLGWGSICTAARCTASQVGYGTGGGSFSYDDDLEPDEEQFEGVAMSDPFDGVVMSRLAFDRLMLRFFRVIISVADRRAQSVRDEAWWPEFLEHVSAIEARCHAHEA